MSGKETESGRLFMIAQYSNNYRTVPCRTCGSTWIFRQNTIEEYKLDSVWECPQCSREYVNVKEDSAE